MAKDLERDGDKSKLSNEIQQFPQISLVTIICNICARAGGGRNAPLFSIYRLVKVVRGKFPQIRLTACERLIYRLHKGLVANEQSGSWLFVKKLCLR